MDWESQKARLLFCYLIITFDQWIHRDKLMEVLWPGCNVTAGAKNFKTTLSRLRKSFQNAGCANPVLTQGEAIRLNYGIINVDSSSFKNAAITGIKLMTRGDLQGARRNLENAQDLYHGDFLPEEPFDPFISAARKEFNDLHVSVFGTLEKIYASEDKADALEALITLRKLPLGQPA